MSDNIYMKVGPRGLVNSEAWDDGIFQSLLTIFILHSEDSINSIQFAYVDQCGNNVLSPRHGGDGTNFEMIKVEGPISSVSGWCYNEGSYRGSRIASLTFNICGRTYGPYGNRSEYDCTQFSFNVSGDYIKGFHGCACDDYLRAIGVHVDTNVTQQGSSIAKASPLVPKRENYHWA